MPNPVSPASQPPALERPRRGARADEDVLTALYEEHRTEIFAFLLRMTRDRETAEDVLQEAFVHLVEQVRAGRMPDNVRAWLYRSAANAAISRARRRAIWTRLVPRLVDRRDPAQPETEFLRSERETELHRALAALEPDGRASLLLAAQGFSGAEIAATIHRSEAATRTLMCRSRVQLRLLLEPAEGSR